MEERDKVYAEANGMLAQIESRAVNRLSDGNEDLLDKVFDAMDKYRLDSYTKVVRYVKNVQPEWKPIVYHEYTDQIISYAHDLREESKGMQQEEQPASDQNQNDDAAVQPLSMPPANTAPDGRANVQMPSASQSIRQSAPQENRLGPMPDARANVNGPMGSYVSVPPDGYVSEQPDTKAKNDELAARLPQVGEGTGDYVGQHGTAGR